MVIGVRPWFSGFLSPKGPGNHGLGNDDSGCNSIFSTISDSSYTLVPNCINATPYFWNAIVRVMPWFSGFLFPKGPRILGPRNGDSGWTRAFRHGVSDQATSPLAPSNLSGLVYLLHAKIRDPRK